jgi:hypothetical protein
MKTFKKFYIGKGTQVEGLDIAKCTCRLEDLEQFSYEYDGVKYVTFEVAKMKQTDNFGRDYTLYVSKKEETVETENKSKKACKKAKKSKRELEPAGKEEDDRPF